MERQSFRRDTADFLGTGMMVVVLKQVGTLSCDSEMLKMSVMSSTSWLTLVLSTRPGMLSGPAALLMFTLSRVFLTSAVDTDSSRSSGGGVDLTADSFLRRSKQT